MGPHLPQPALKTAVRSLKPGGRVDLGGLLDLGESLESDAAGGGGEVAGGEAAGGPLRDGVEPSPAAKAVASAAKASDPLSPLELLAEMGRRHAKTQLETQSLLREAAGVALAEEP